MLFHPTQNLAISQPAHAWLSGQLLQAWATPLPPPLLLAAEQHDIGWLDWETAPTFDLATGRPHLFRHVPSAQHAPMWARGVERALAAWGQHVALLVSRHGSVIYTRFTDPARLPPDDAAAIRQYLATQKTLQNGWAAALSLTPEILAYETGFVALSDTLSLALCGELRTPLTLEAPTSGGTTPIRLCQDATGTFTLSPWPFAAPTLTFEIEARPLPETGRFPDEAAMRTWHAGPGRTKLRLDLAPGPATAEAAPTRGFPIS